MLRHAGIDLVVQRGRQRESWLPSAVILTPVMQRAALTAQYLATMEAHERNAMS